MNLFKKITYSEKFKSFISIFIIFFFMNNLIAFGSENKSVSFKSKNSDNEFDEAFFENSIPFNEYDNSENQLKIFFGKWRYPNRSENSFYPDLSIIKNSVSVRDTYKSKLNDMVIKEINHNIFK